MSTERPKAVVFDPADQDPWWWDRFTAALPQGELDLDVIDPDWMLAHRVESFTLHRSLAPTLAPGDVVPITFAGYPEAGGYFEVSVDGDMLTLRRVRKEVA